MCVRCWDNSMGNEYSSTNDDGVIGFQMCKIELWPLRQTVHKNYLKNGPSVRVKIMKLLEENLGGENLYDLGLGKVFLDMTTKAQAIEEKKNKWTSKVKNICASKYMFKKMKRQDIYWKIIFANHVSDKGFISRVYI